MQSVVPAHLSERALGTHRGDIFNLYATSISSHGGTWVILERLCFRASSESPLFLLPHIAAMSSCSFLVFYIPPTSNHGRLAVTSPLNPPVASFNSSQWFFSLSWPLYLSPLQSFCCGGVLPRHTCALPAAEHSFQVRFQYHSLAFGNRRLLLQGAGSVVIVSRGLIGSSGSSCDGSRYSESKNPPPTDRSTVLSVVIQRQSPVS